MGPGVGLRRGAIVAFEVGLIGRGWWSGGHGGAIGMIADGGHQGLRDLGNREYGIGNRE
jgi:hypothetical protein